MPSATRAWPAPFIDRTFHLVGDVQGIPYVSTKTNRADKVLRDMARPGIPPVAHTLQVGDFVSSGPETYFTPTRDFMNQATGSGHWYGTVGNHDKPVTELEPTYARTADQAAALIGLPGKNYAVDLGYAVLIGFFIRAWGFSTEEAPNTAWLAATLDQYPGRICMVMVHPPLRGSLPNNAADMLAVDYAAIAPILDARPQAKMWLCGHTHSPLIDPIVNYVNVGTRNIVQINGSALLNTAPGDDQDFWDPLRTLYVTVLPNSCEVRFRDHGAGVWIGGTTSIARKITMLF